MTQSHTSLMETGVDYAQGILPDEWINEAREETWQYGSEFPYEPFRSRFGVDILVAHGPTLIYLHPHDSQAVVKHQRNTTNRVLGSSRYREAALTRYFLETESDYLQFIAPVIAHSWDYRWVVMRRARQVASWQELPSFSLPDSFQRDMTLDNLGILDNRVVSIDYGDVGKERHFPKAFKKK